MDSFFRDYWWLMFPIGAFLFGAWDRWLGYRRSRDHLDLIRSYADQGKEPPAELLRGVHDGAMDDGDRNYPGYGAPWTGAGGMRRAYRHDYRWGPYWQWRKVFVLGALAAGFWWAADFGGVPGAHGGLRIVAVVLTCVAAANLAFALLSWGRRDR